MRTLGSSRGSIKLELRVRLRFGYDRMAFHTPDSKQGCDLRESMRMFGIKTRFMRWWRARRTLHHNWRILRDEYGQHNSLMHEACLDSKGNHVPWFTYPAIEYLNQIDLSGMRVLEFGSGYSTLYWARRAGKVVSIEDSKSWYERMSARMPNNVEYILAPSREEIVATAVRQEGKFDLIVNDGVYRYDCAQATRDKLADGGMVIVDNSDWCPRTCALYREQDLIEVDMAGFTPLNQYTMTTSFFLSRNIRLRPAHACQPVLAVGGEQVSEEELSEFVRG